MGQNFRHGVLEDESWSGIASALRFGTRGLPGGTRLADIKAKYGFTNFLNEMQILNWVKLFKEKEGRWPTKRDENVWDLAEGIWFCQPETWAALSLALARGQRGLGRAITLPALCKDHGLHDDFSEQKIIRWIKLFKQKEGRWPTRHDEAVWDQDAAGNWVPHPERWPIIEEALSAGRRGLRGGTTLQRFRAQHDLVDQFTIDEVARLIALFIEKENMFPNTRSAKPVWDRTIDGKWVRKEISWRQLEKALVAGNYGLPGGNRLSQLRAIHVDLQSFSGIPEEPRPDALRRAQQRRNRKHVSPS